MKKILSYIITSIVAVCLVGCAAFNSWFSSVDWNTVNTITIPVVQSTAKTTVYLVCEKNKDLKPIFVAAGNGILLAIANNQFDATQIQTYIKQALGNDADKYYPIINASMQTLIDGYTTFYKLNWKSTDDESEKVTVEAVFSKYLSALATGVIEGAQLTADQFKAVAAKQQMTFAEVNKLHVIR